MIRILLVSILLFATGCSRYEKEVQVQYPYDLEERVEWVLAFHHGRGFDVLKREDAWRIVRAIEANGWNQKRYCPVEFINISYANFAEESSFNPGDVDHPEWSPSKRSYGIAQVQGETASLILPGFVDYPSLMTDYELCIRLGMIHLADVGTIQAYNAGAGGARRGLGENHAKKVRRTLGKIPWVVNSEHGGKLEEEYGRFFGSRPGNGPARRDRSRGRDKDGRLLHLGAERRR